MGSLFAGCDETISREIFMSPAQAQFATVHRSFAVSDQPIVPNRDISVAQAERNAKAVGSERLHVVGKLFLIGFGAAVTFAWALALAWLAWLEAHTIFF
jgi:hypothetical protein